MRDDSTLEAIADAVAGDRTALAELVDRLTPVIQERVAWVLVLRQPWAERRNVRQEVEDLTQEIFLALFAHRGKTLRAWHPDGGLAFDRYVGLVAERRVTSVLRSRQRNPWQHRPTAPEVLDRGATGERGPYARAASRQLYERLLDRLRDDLSPLGWRLFELLFVREKTVAETRAATGLSADAVYAWRSRLRKAARKLAEELEDRSPRTEPRRRQQGGTSWLSR